MCTGLYTCDKDYNRVLKHWQETKGGKRCKGGIQGLRDPCVLWACASLSQLEISGSSDG